MLFKKLQDNQYHSYLVLLMNKEEIKIKTLGTIILLDSLTEISCLKIVTFYYKNYQYVIY